MSATPIAAPRWLDPTLPCWLRQHATDGLLAVVSVPHPPWAGDVLAGDDTAELVWAAASPLPERAGLHALHRPHIRAISLAPAGRELHRVRTAIQVAYLLAGSTPDAAAGRAHLTSVERPAIIDRSMRIPHLTTVRFGDGSVIDTVIWELTALAAAPIWSRIQPADRVLVEANVHRLVALRTAARAGRLPATTAGRRLAEILGNRPLSIRIVYRHLDAIRQLLDEGIIPARRRPHRAHTPPPAESSDNVVALGAETA